jgi:hypothetical protein
VSHELWIEIVDWDKFQHYKKRDPNWIKIYTRLVHDDNWLELTGHQRAVLVGLWLEYASSHARLRLDTRSLSSRLGLRVTRATLETLNHAGFIRFSASTPLASRARSREVETEIEKSLQVQLPNNLGTGPSELERELAHWQAGKSKKRTKDNPWS